MKKYLLLSAFSLFILSGLTRPRFAFSQGKLGVVWEVPLSESQAIHELGIFRKAGIRYLIVNSEIPLQLLDTLKSYPFKIYVDIPVHYPTSRDLERNAIRFFQKYQDAIHRFDKQPVVAGYGLFNNGELSSAAFRKGMDLLLNKVQGITNKPIFYLQNFDPGTSPDTTFSFYIQQINQHSALSQLNEIKSQKLKGFYFKSTSNDFYNSSKLQNVFNLSHSSGIYLFLNSKWLMNTLHRYPDFFYALNDYNKGSPLLLGRTKLTRHYNVGDSIIVILLLIIWGGLALHYSKEPNYGKSVNRYFTTHNFFVDDVMERLTRLPDSNLIVLAGQGIIGGMFFYALGQATLSQSGFQGLVYHYPILGFLDGNLFSLFFLGLLFVMLYNIICIIWIFFGVSEIEFIGQALTIYTWPQHINIILITIMITLLMSHITGVLFLIPAVLFVLVIFSSFYITIFDTARYSPKPFLHHLKTTIPHFIILAGAMYLLLTHTHIIDVLRLTIHL